MLVAREPVRFGEGLRSVENDWKGLLANDYQHFLTDNQLSVYVHRAKPGLERIHFYPLPFPHEFRHGKWDFGELMQYDCIRGVGPVLDMEPDDIEYSFLPHLVEKHMIRRATSVSEVCAVSGNTCGIEWDISGLERVGLSFALPHYAAQAGPIRNGILLSIMRQAYVALTISGAELSVPEIRQEEPFELRAELAIPGGRGEVSLSLACGYDGDLVAQDALEAAGDPRAVFDRAERTWNDFFTKIVPHFSCSDRNLERLYYYCAWVTRANLYDIPYEPFTQPYTCPWKTGALWQWSWNTPVAAIQERWLNDKRIGESGILLLGDNGGALNLGSYLRPTRRQTALREHNKQMALQVEYRKNGLPDDFDFDALTVMAHTTPNGLLGAWELYISTGDRAWLSKALEVMIDAERQFSKHALENCLCTCMFVDDFDYSLRWRPFSSNWKPASYEWELDTPVIAVDYNCYLYALRERIIEATEELGTTSVDVDALRAANERLKSAINEYLWDDEVGFYFDADPRNMKRSDVKCIAAFSSLYSGIADRKRAARLVEHLTDPAEFSAPYPCPSVSMDTPDFDPSIPSLGGDCLTTTGLWFTVEGLVKHGFRDLAAGYTIKAIEMMTRNGRVTASDSYNAVTGESNRRNNELTQQGLIIVDLICKYVLGFAPRRRGGFQIDPLALDRSGVGSFRFGPYRFRNSWVTLSWSRAEGYRFDVEGLS